MNVVSMNPLAVPDSAFPFASSELAGLLDPPTSPPEFPLGAEELKLGSMQEEDGYFPFSDYTSFPFDQDYLYGQPYEWMHQDFLLPTPEEQGTDVGPFLPSPPASSSPSSSLPTPDASNPSTPASHCHDSDVLDALSLIDGSPTSHLNHSTEILPQFEGQSPLPSPANYNPSSVTYSPSLPTYDLPSSSTCDPTMAEPFLPSPLSTSSQDLSPDTNYAFSACSGSPLPHSPDTASSAHPKGIRDLLVKTEDTPSGSGCSLKRRQSESSTSSDGGRVKRKKLTKVAKKERKKEQNKQAALRYRQRKKGEVDEIDDKREQLEALNSDLKKQVSALSAEIAYLKNLWSEIEAAKAQKAISAASDHKLQ